MKKRDFLVKLGGMALGLITLPAMLKSKSIKGISTGTNQPKENSSEDDKFLRYLCHRTTSKRIVMDKVDNNRVFFYFEGRYHNKKCHMLWTSKEDIVMSHSTKERMIATVRNYNNWGTPIKEWVF